VVFCPVVNTVLLVGFVNVCWAITVEMNETRQDNANKVENMVERAMMSWSRIEMIRLVV